MDLKQSGEFKIVVHANDLDVSCIYICVAI